MTSAEYAATRAESRVPAPHASRIGIRGAHAPRRALVPRALAIADVCGLAAALAVTALLPVSAPGLGGSSMLVLALAVGLAWVVVAQGRGLYERDVSRTDHSTLEEFPAIFQALTIGIWFAAAIEAAHLLPGPAMGRSVLFWLTSVFAVTAGRVATRTAVRRAPGYRQRTLIVGAGDIGQLVGRKLLLHDEYGIEIVGFVDSRPKERRAELTDVDVMTMPDDFAELVRTLRVERVVFAFTNERHDRMIELIRSLAASDVEIDVVPRLFDVIGPNAALHDVEGLPLVSISSARVSRGERGVKRAIDIVGASALLLISAPFFALIALWVHRDSPGPVFFRQRRLGLGMQPFTALKFRTMHVGSENGEHRRYIASTMSAGAAPEANGLYKLERPAAVTRSGYWLRKTSLDELPQLLNVLRGEMSLVGPRPCLDYETEFFEPHHFERFRVPAGITGLWQVTARACSTFREALDLDVAYVRGWTLGLDVKLLLRTPLQLLRLRGTA
jgi:exopolysaccharide biosynthesis polyprenyl glycosylphosphotransferase